MTALATVMNCHNNCGFSSSSNITLPKPSSPPSSMRRLQISKIYVAKNIRVEQKWGRQKENKPILIFTVKKKYFSLTLCFLLKLVCYYCFSNTKKIISFKHYIVEEKMLLKNLYKQENSENIDIKVPYQRHDQQTNW